MKRKRWRIGKRKATRVTQVNVRTISVSVRYSGRKRNRKSDVKIGEDNLLLCSIPLSKEIQLTFCLRKRLSHVYRHYYCCCLWFLFWVQVFMFFRLHFPVLHIGTHTAVVPMILVMSLLLSSNSWVLKWHVVFHLQLRWLASLFFLLQDFRSLQEEEEKRCITEKDHTLKKTGKTHALQPDGWDEMRLN